MNPDQTTINVILALVGAGIDLLPLLSGPTRETVIAQMDAAERTLDTHPPGSVRSAIDAVIAQHVQVTHADADVLERFAQGVHITDEERLSLTKLARLTRSAVGHAATIPTRSAFTAFHPNAEDK